MFKQNKFSEQLSSHNYQHAMKALLIAGSVTMLGIGVAQALISQDTERTEQQPYEVLWKNSILEVRYYPEAVLVSVESKNTAYKSSSNNHFRALAGYIFGGNEREQSIAMTAPVHMKFDEEGSTMSFVMPSNMSLEDLPEANNKDLVFSESRAMYVVAIEFGGWANDDNIAKHATKLTSTLSELGVQIENEPWYMGYNPPYQMVNRRNEVAVEITEEQQQYLRDKF